MISCPVCKTPATDGVKFCRKCGASIRGDDEPGLSRGTGDRFDWSRTWLAEMLLTGDERARRRAAVELSGRPEELVAAELAESARLEKEIKNGIVTTFAGIGLTIFLLVFMGTIAAMQADPKVATMLNSLWVVGTIPFLVGIGLLVNAIFVSSRFSRHRRTVLNSVLASGAMDHCEPGTATGEIPRLEAPPSVVPSVVEHTTERLIEPEPVRRGNPARRTTD